MLLRLAWRNLWRHRARTLTMASAVGFSYALLLISMGIGDDGHRQMLEAATEGAGGEVLVHGAGWWAERGSDRLVRDAAAVRAAAEATPGVAAAIPRVIVQALVSTSAGNRPVELSGIVPALEAGLRDPGEDLVAGTFLSEGGPDDPLVLGARLVDALDLELGDRVVVTATDATGELTRALFHLTGIIETGSREADELLGYTTLEAARQVIGAGGAVTQIGLVVEPGIESDSVARALRGALGPAAADLEVLTWQEAIPEMVGFIEIDDAFLYVYLVVIFVVVAFAITNTFLMAVMERVRELGLLSALGLRGRRVALLLLAEATLLTALAMVAGLVLGLAGHFAIDHWGVSVAAAWGLEEMELSGVDLSDMVMRSELRPAKWAVASGLVALLTVGAALYPAWRATRLAPAEAMRFFE